MSLVGRESQPCAGDQEAVVRERARGEQGGERNAVARNVRPSCRESIRSWAKPASRQGALIRQLAQHSAAEKNPR